MGVIKSSSLSLPGLCWLADCEPLKLKRKYHRHHCLHRRCMPLHSRVPFP
uniref:Uncharacterized protein n=1 Tax=Oryzias sinensis TaxID=183150 RepID=A0A8C8E3U9_9TELE